jgi:hypothetical protein
MLATDCMGFAMMVISDRVDWKLFKSLSNVFCAKEEL